MVFQKQHSALVNNTLRDAPITEKCIDTAGNALMAKIAREPLHEGIVGRHQFAKWTVTCSSCGRCRASVEGLIRALAEGMSRSGDGYRLCASELKNAEGYTLGLHWRLDPWVLQLRQQKKQQQ
jgi:hypothetical protein